MNPAKKTALVVALGERVRVLREVRGQTQDQLAKDLGISVPHLSSIESGRQTPSLEFVLDVAEIFDVEVGTLLAARKGRPPTRAAVEAPADGEAA